MTNPFHNIHNELLADTLGDLDAKIKALQAEAKLVKTELHDRKVETVAGERFQITRTETVRWTLDQKALKEEFGEEWYNERSKQAVVESLRITVRKEKLAAAA
jgi:hypothetical protein